MSKSWHNDTKQSWTENQRVQNSKRRFDNVRVHKRKHASNYSNLSF